MKENNIYLISGKNILKFIDLIDHLKDLSLDYADDTGQDAYKLENNFQMLKEDILKSDIFADIDLSMILQNKQSITPLSLKFHLVWRE